MTKSEKLFKYVGYLEGISYLVLLGIAMPMKYMMGMDKAVAMPGMAHGALFVLYCVVLLVVGIANKWGLKKMLWGFAASLFPFGPWIFHKKWMSEELDTGLDTGQ